MPLQEKDANLYRPSNGTEGDSFTSAWCANCCHHDFDDIIGCKQCQIILSMFAFDIDDPGYPKQLCYDMDGNPQCTAFAATEKETVEQYRCDNTIDMFGDTK